MHLHSSSALQIIRFECLTKVPAKLRSIESFASRCSVNSETLRKIEASGFGTCVNLIKIQSWRYYGISWSPTRVNGLINVSSSSAVSHARHRAESPLRSRGSFATRCTREEDTLGDDLGPPSRGSIPRDTLSGYSETTSAESEVNRRRRRAESSGADFFSKQHVKIDGRRVRKGQRGRNRFERIPRSDSRKKEARRSVSGTAPPCTRRAHVVLHGSARRREERARARRWEKEKEGASTDIARCETGLGAAECRRRIPGRRRPPLVSRECVSEPVDVKLT